MIRIPLVTQERFAEISCMDGYAFGVKTNCDSCDFNLNPCLRRNLLDKLSENQSLMERILGYDLSPTYHYDDIWWDGRSRIILQHGRVSAVNVVQETELVTGSSFDISPYIAQGIVPVFTSPRYIITVDHNYLGNPAHAIVRLASSGSVIPQDISGGYPRRNVDGDWEIAIEAESIAEVDVQHCRFIFLTIPTPYCGDGEIIAVKPGTEIYVPFAVDPVEVAGDTIYTFYAWSLVDPVFAEDGLIDLLAGEFYKLLSTIDLMCLTEAEEIPSILQDNDGCSVDCPISSSSLNVTTKIIAGDVIELTVNQCARTCSTNAPIQIRIFYKTDPELWNNNLDNLAEALVYLTAAELPLSVCNCPLPEYGFIEMAQKPYTEIKINPITGVTYAPLKYGSRHGQMVFTERLSKARKMERSVVL